MYLSHPCQLNPPLSTWPVLVNLTHACQLDPSLLTWPIHVNLTQSCQLDPSFSTWPIRLRRARGGVCLTMSQPSDAMTSWCRDIMRSCHHEVMTSWCHDITTSRHHDVMASWCHGMMMSWHQEVVTSCSLRHRAHAIVLWVKLTSMGLLNKDGATRQERGYETRISQVNKHGSS